VAHRMGIDIVRVHDVLEHRDLFETLNAFSRKA
jgi:dihydropteroate synthase